MKRTVETDEYVSFVRRIIRAYSRRVGDADEVDLAAMMSVRLEMDRAVVLAIAGQRERGVSWSTIGAGMGMTKQGAEQWFRRTVRTLQMDL